MCIYVSVESIEYSNLKHWTSIGNQHDASNIIRVDNRISKNTENLIRRGRGDNSTLRSRKNSFRDKFSLSFRNIPANIFNFQREKRKKGNKTIRINVRRKGYSCNDDPTTISLES